MFSLIVLLSLGLVAHALDPKAVSDSNGITLWEKIEEMERQLLQPATLNSLVSPCSTNFGASPFQGQQTSAEWVRLVFHDCITKNIEGPGLGGLDASIGFESGRPENVGIFIDVSIGQFDQFTSVYLSMADLIGVGLSDSLATCAPSSRRISLRVGRVDATQAGPFGVPGPADTLDFATTAFDRAGFSKTEMIQAVACGHSIGGVHGSDFKGIGTEGTVDNESGRVPFDTTPGVFDANNVNEYLEITGSKGGPLVTANDTFNSDFRIFNSDHNDTVTAMRAPSTFEDTCFNIFDKMMNTVPDALQLSDPFQVRPFIMRQSSLDLTPAGVLVFNGTISAHAPTPPNTVAYSYPGSNLGDKSTDVGVELPGFFDSRPPVPPQEPVYIGYNIIKDYKFGDVIGAEPVESIAITSPGATYTGDINTSIFILPSQSHRQLNQGGIGSWMLRVAVLSTLTTSAPTATVYYPTPQDGSKASKVVFATASLEFETTLGSYKIYKSSKFIGEFAPAAVGRSAVFKVSAGSTLVATKLSSDAFANTCTATDISSC